jgi:arabinosaccharide transport system substrate-binding protein
MPERFPFGRAPLWLLVLSLASSIAVLVTQRLGAVARPDLSFATSAANHMAAYREAAAVFERKRGVRVSVELVHSRALQTRLQNAMLAQSPVPDLVELLSGDIAFFTRGPLSDVGLVDLTERLDKEGLKQRLVESRLSLWSSRGHAFALPHDVHPVMLMYRADILESLGIDVNAIETWDDFVALRSKVVKDLDGDGVIDRYLIDLPIGEAWGVLILLLQRGVSLFDEHGKLQMNQPATVSTIEWYVHQVEGEARIATPCGWGQSLMKAMKDGLAVFYFAPDWRTHSIEMEAPNVRGLFRVMPLPAATPGGRRTSTWGGSGLAITKATRHLDLAWDFAKLLYVDREELGRRYRATKILPPLKDSWTLPEFAEPSEFYRGQRIGEEFAKLAPDVPPDWATPYKSRAEDRLGRVVLRAIEHFRAHGDDGLRALIQTELAEKSAQVEVLVNRNVLDKQ